ncbi:GNAT family N-acetyltransferase [Jeotgalibaca caeni]|uniref:GNAT family N-acetyltransferase n=1 Tax=Jeotgalibaca caeni TaxID=3028623 RepID=UPI00237D655A|nr:GNAT family N-acetyltransferase [Jeotgalibaca caeni]MDE1548596.1 GNAT family N-acetyltransferase [Jeotgalibaca caeni]
MWEAKRFNELTVYELHQIYALRIAIFVVEQNCPYQEVDELDLESIHFFKQEDGKLISYARIIPAEDGIRLGRVIVHPDYRKQQQGQELLREALRYGKTHFPNVPIHLAAQAHLERFYGAFGFQAVSEIYLEDDIPHIDMILSEQEGVNHE